MKIPIQMMLTVAKIMGLPEDEIKQGLFDSSDEEEILIDHEAGTMELTDKFFVAFEEQTGMDIKPFFEMVSANATPEDIEEVGKMLRDGFLSEN